jgi:hypothetical protein
MRNGDGAGRESSKVSAKELSRTRRIASARSARANLFSGVEVEWRDYQRAAAEFFTSLGLTAEVDATVTGSRATHDVDVLVRFATFGINHMWVVECKSWSGAFRRTATISSTVGGRPDIGVLCFAADGPRGSPASSPASACAQPHRAAVPT